MMDVAAWLSEQSSSPQQPPVTPTKFTSKRKRLDDNHHHHHHLDPPQKYPQSHHLYHHHLHHHHPPSLTHTALTELSLDIMMNTPSPSARQRSKKTKPTLTSQTDASHPSYEAASRPPTATPSSSSGAKPTPNEDNVRAASAKQGMFFEDEASYEKYPDFQARIEQTVFGERGSAMRVESLKKIKTWRVENATKDEKSFFATATSLVIKDERSTATQKRTFRDEVVYQAKSFKSDGLDEKQDCLFVKNILPLRTTYAEAAQLGVTTPKPDFVYGLQRPRFPDGTQPVLSVETVAEIEVAPGLQHAFFAVDNKGAQHSIEGAENQAMRSGATMVAARRRLNRKTKGKAQPTAETAAIAVDTAIVGDTATRDASGTAADATANTTALDPPANETTDEDLGADTDSYAFTCSWVPQMANIHVHWCERCPGGSEIYHMNLLRGYLMSDDGHVADFRKDIHNILDWGIDPRRKMLLEQLERDIAKCERGGQ